LLNLPTCPELDCVAGVSSVKVGSPTPTKRERLQQETRTQTTAYKNERDSKDRNNKYSSYRVAQNAIFLQLMDFFLPKFQDLQGKETVSENLTEKILLLQKLLLLQYSIPYFKITPKSGQSLVLFNVQHHFSLHIQKIC